MEINWFYLYDASFYRDMFLNRLEIHKRNISEEIVLNKIKIKNRIHEKDHKKYIKKFFFRRHASL